MKRFGCVGELKGLGLGFFMGKRGLKRRCKCVCVKTVWWFNKTPWGGNVKARPARVVVRFEDFGTPEIRKPKLKTQKARQNRKLWMSFVSF